MHELKDKEMMTINGGGPIIVIEVAIDWIYEQGKAFGRWLCRVF